jgi:UDP-3-O-[3-hydroxymyristoyl] glucosamine N-acyltransferase
MITYKHINEIIKHEFPENISFNNIGLVGCSEKNTLTYCIDQKYIHPINSNKNITGVIIQEKLKAKLRNDILPILADEPQLAFFKLYNHVHMSLYKKIKTKIDRTAIIHKSSSIAEHNVIIGKNVTIEPNVSILPDVVIGDNCVIKANAVLGVDDVEAKMTSEGLINVFHNGKIIIQENVSIGANTTIVKGVYGQDTIINQGTFVSNNCHIGHSVQIGKDCLILTCFICGSSKVGDCSRISPGAVISNKISIGKNAHISIGAVVIKNVSPNTSVSGNYALEHKRFLYKHIKTYGPL